jgi:hypothetical protein
MVWAYRARRAGTAWVADRVLSCVNLRPPVACALLLVPAVALCACGGDNGTGGVGGGQQYQTVMTPQGPVQMPVGAPFSANEIRLLVSEIQTGRRTIESLTPRERQMLFVASARRGSGN